jgi:hypothetical protein
MTAYVPSARELLDVWDAGQALPPVPRALALLSAARPDLSPRALAELPIGRRDGELLSLRERLFGPGIVALTRCARCEERFELTFAVADVRVPSPDHGTTLVEVDGYAVRVRPARSVDLMDVDAGDDTLAAERAVIARCTLDAHRGAVAVLADELPGPVTDAVAQAMATADPQADVQVATECPACGHQDDVLLDIAEFLWREVDAWAIRTLDEVHALARAYGWSEHEILSMSASRRGRYVAMVAER